MGELGRSRRRLGVLVATVVALAAGACAAEPLTTTEFEATTGVAAPVQPDPTSVAAADDDFFDGDDVFDDEGDDDFDDEGDVSRAPAGEARAETKVGFGDGAAVIATAISRLGGERSLIGVVLYDGYASVTAQDVSSGDIDRVMVRGFRAEAPTAMRDATVRDPQAARFAPSDVDWQIIPRLVEVTPTDLGIAEGTVSHVIVEKNLPFTPDLVIRVYVTHPRRGGRIDYFADGRPMRTFKD